MENMALWHERDITHSSVERVVVPDSCILLDYMLSLMTDIVDRLVVYPDHMKRNLDLTHGLVFSQSVLLALTSRGMSREDAYRHVQRAAMEVWKTGTTFREQLIRSPEITAVLPEKDLDAFLDPGKSIRHVETIFKRVGLA